MGYDVVLLRPALPLDGCLSQWWFSVLKEEQSVFEEEEEEVAEEVVG